MRSYSRSQVQSLSINFDIRHTYKKLVQNRNALQIDVEGNGIREREEVKTFYTLFPPSHSCL